MEWAKKLQKTPTQRHQVETVVHTVRYECMVILCSETTGLLVTSCELPLKAGGHGDHTPSLVDTIWREQMSRPLRR